MEEKYKKSIISRGKIKVYKGNTLRVVTFYKGEETIDYFSFEEILRFIENGKTNKTNINA